MTLPPNLADWPDDWKFLYQERAAIMEYEGGFPRPEAQEMAEKDIRWQARASQFPRPKEKGVLTR